MHCYVQLCWSIKKIVKNMKSGSFSPFENVKFQLAGLFPVIFEAWGTFDDTRLESPQILS